MGTIDKILLSESFLNELDSRIVKLPLYDSWTYSAEFGGGRDCFFEESEINTEGLTEHEMFVLYVHAWNKSDMCPSRSLLMKRFGWTKYKIGKLFKELKNSGLESVATFSEETGLLCGRGYRFYKPK